MAADPLKLDSAVTPSNQQPGAEQEDTLEWNWSMEPLLNIYNLIPDLWSGSCPLFLVNNKVIIVDDLKYFRTFFLGQ